MLSFMPMPPDGHPGNHPGFPEPGLQLAAGDLQPRPCADRRKKWGLPGPAARDQGSFRACAVSNVVDNDDKVVARTVTAAERIGNLWVIEKGLEAGDRVIVEGIQRVQPGAKVQYKVEPEPKLELGSRPRRHR